MTVHVAPDELVVAPLACRVLRNLRIEIGEERFTSWCGRLELDGVDRGVAQFSVPTKFLKSWLDQHFKDRILRAVSAEVAGVRAVAVVVRSSAARGTQEAAQPAAPAPVVVATQKATFPLARPEPLPPAGSPLDRRWTFATFHGGRSNEIALTAARGVAALPDGQPPLFSPLYVHSAVGLGKTHLLQAIAQDAAAHGKHAVYLTAERFMYGFVQALRAQTMLAYQEALRDVDVLLIDDAQFLLGKSIQREFCNTINAVLGSGRQLVVAADRAPAELDELDDRVRSRLSGGLCVEIPGLDEALRIRLLEARVAALRKTMPAFDLAPEVVAYVASVIQTNGRDLEGAVNRLMAHAVAAQVPVTVSMAEVAIRDLVRTPEPRRIKVEDIQKLVATHYNVNRADILSSRRTANVVRPRQIAMYLSKTLTLRSLPEIGRRFGGRDHTTVLHAVRKIEGLSITDRALGDELADLRRLLTEA